MFAVRQPSTRRDSRTSERERSLLCRLTRHSDRTLATTAITDMRLRLHAWVHLMLMAAAEARPQAARRAERRNPPRVREWGHPPAAAIIEAKQDHRLRPHP